MYNWFLLLFIYLLFLLFKMYFFSLGRECQIQSISSERITCVTPSYERTNMTVFPGENLIWYSDLLWWRYISVTIFSIVSVCTTVEFCISHARKSNSVTAAVSHVISTKTMILVCHVADFPKKHYISEPITY